MPLCRNTTHLPPAPPQIRRVTLSDYVVSRRPTFRAVNDNRRPRRAHRWQWAVGIAVAPTLTVALILAALL
ncbi:hypothetical protein LKMONMHP_3554 [Methylobacterium organophilum]|uniref:Uncharacterized protein n=1 Tax=Methylobacterium organophilum TaxID=410 RepID=A0ABQ4TAH6_METOR|nr:hypothetical protein LKMONMHP_3554 [Methylobacterium organophilum]